MITSTSRASVILLVAFSSSCGTGTGPGWSDDGAAGAGGDTAALVGAEGTALTLVMGPSGLAGTSVRITGRRVSPVDATTPTPADAKYRCDSSVTPGSCFDLDVTATARLDGLCPSDVFPAGLWTFDYELYADAGCAGTLLNGPGGPYTCVDSHDLFSEDHPNQTVGEWLEAGSDNHNAIVCSAQTDQRLTYGGTGPVATRTTSGTMTVSYPAGSSPGDLLLLVELKASNQAFVTPAGWTVLANQLTGTPAQFRFVVAWKLAGAETSVSHAVNTSPTGVSTWVVRYYRPGGYPPNPAVATALVGAGLTGPSATLTPSPNVTTNQADAAVISIVAIRSANALSLTTPQGFSLQNATTSNPSQGVGLGLADRLVAASGSTPASPTWTQAGTPAQWAWATVAFH